LPGGRIVYQDIDAAQLVDCLLNDGAAMIWPLHIARDQDDLASFLLDQGFHFLGVVILAQIRNQDISALPRVSNRNSAPDAAVTACNDRLHAFQAA